MTFPASAARLNELDVWQAARLLARREVGAVDLACACLDRVAQRDGEVHAFVHLDTDAALAQARALDAGPPRWKVGSGLAVDFELTMAPALVAELKVLGHRFEATPDTYMDYGSGQSIWKLSDDLEDGFVATSDSRRDGQTSGF